MQISIPSHFALFQQKTCSPSEYGKLLETESFPVVEPHAPLPGPGFNCQPYCYPSVLPTSFHFPSSGKQDSVIFPILGMCINLHTHASYVCMDKNACMLLHTRQSPFVRHSNGHANSCKKASAFSIPNDPMPSQLKQSAQATSFFVFKHVFSLCEWIYVMCTHCIFKQFPTLTAPIVYLSVLERTLLLVDLADNSQTCLFPSCRSLSGFPMQTN